MIEETLDTVLWLTHMHITCPSMTTPHSDDPVVLQDAIIAEQTGNRSHGLSESLLVTVNLQSSQNEKFN